jgi:hypothetical protein
MVHTHGPFVRLSSHRRQRRLRFGFCACLAPHSADRLALQWKEAKFRVEFIRQGAPMKKPFLLAAVVLFGSMLALAGKPQMGTIISENSVACGSTVEKGKKNKQMTVEVLCQQYVVRTAGTDYHIRQLKPSEKALIPVNTPIEFTLDKEKMKFKANGQSYEYLIVSEAAVSVEAAKP